MTLHSVPSRADLRCGQDLLAVAIAIESGALALCPVGHIIGGTGDCVTAVRVALKHFRAGKYRNAFESEHEIQAAVERMVIAYSPKRCLCVSQASRIPACDQVSARS